MYTIVYIFLFILLLLCNFLNVFWAYLTADCQVVFVLRAKSHGETARRRDELERKDWAGLCYGLDVPSGNLTYIEDGHSVREFSH